LKGEQEYFLLKGAGYPSYATGFRAYEVFHNTVHNTLMHGN